jgi:hypothetical protein
MFNLAEQIREALAMFARSGTEPALIVGLAMVAHGVVRATQDVDFLVELEAADLVHDALLDLGYQCVYRSEDAANYVRATQGLDLLYAHRPLARRLLSQASERESPMGRIRIISVEGLNTSPYLTNENFSMNSSYRTTQNRYRRSTSLLRAQC